MRIRTPGTDWQAVIAPMTVMDWKSETFTQCEQQKQSSMWEGWPGFAGTPPGNAANISSPTATAGTTPSAGQTCVAVRSIAVHASRSSAVSRARKPNLREGTFTLPI